MRKFLLLFFALTALYSNAQQYGFIEYSVSEGLAQSQVNCLFQDSQGYIWCGTLGGLSRFDGRKFTNFSRRQGLPSNHVTCVSEDADGRIIVGLIGAVAIIESGDLYSISLPDDYADKQVNDILISEKEILLATSGGLLVMSGGAVREVGNDHPGFRQNVKSIRKWGEELLMVTRQKAFRLNGISANLLYDPGQGNYIFDAEVSEDGTIWIAARENGIIRFSQDHVIDTLDMGDGLISSTITEISSRGDEVWFASEFGVSRWKKGELTSYSAESGLPSENINVTLVDREGILWLGSAGTGLIQFAGDKIVSFTPADGLCGNAVLGITRDTAGGLWMATYEGNLCRWNGGGFSEYSNSTLRETSNQFWSAATDDYGHVWFGSSNGLMRLDSDKLSKWSREEGLNHRKVLSLLPGKSGSLYVGTTRGLNVIRDPKNPLIEDVTGIPSVRVRSMLESPDDGLWIASNKGLLHWDEQDLLALTVADGLASNSTYCVELDSKGRLWVGTDNGLSILHGDSVVSPFLDPSFGANVINFLKSADGFMLVGTNSGLFATEVTENLEDLSFENFAVHDGLISLETNLNAVFLDHHDNLWFGTAEGLVKASLPDLLSKRIKYHPTLILEDIQVNLERPDWEKEKIHIGIRNGMPDSLRLKHQSNSLSFYFTGISTSYPKAVSYQYMLEGYDNDWLPPTNVDFAQYRNLPYENFVFKVRAISKDGLFSDEQQVWISITPPFWLQSWFLGIIILLVIGLMWLVVSRRQKALRLNLERERFENRSKMLALEQQTLNSSMNRHFIFNALNSIQYYINGKDRLAANKYLSAFARLIRKNLDSSESNVTSLREEIERLELYLELEHMRFKDKFEYEIRVGDDIDRDNVKVPAMLLQPFLENSIWHGILPAERMGKIWVDISRSNGSIVFAVKDNGIGIDTSLKNKSGGESHISKGMRITSGRIELIKKATHETVEMHGPYEVKDDQGHVSGTEVRIILPQNFHEIYPN